MPPPTAHHQALLVAQPPGGASRCIRAGAGAHSSGLHAGLSRPRPGHQMTPLAFPSTSTFSEPENSKLSHHETSQPTPNALLIHPTSPPAAPCAGIRDSAPRLHWRIRKSYTKTAKRKHGPSFFTPNNQTDQRTEHTGVSRYPESLSTDLAGALVRCPRRPEPPACLSLKQQKASGLSPRVLRDLPTAFYNLKEHN